MYEDLVRTLGALGTILVFTLVSIFVSLILVVGLAQAFQENSNLSGMITAILVSAVLPPLFAYIGFHLATRLQITETSFPPLATTSPLTNFLDRKRLLELADNELALAKRHGAKFSIMLFQVNNLPQIDALYGQRAGDHVLRVMSEICTRQARRTDAFARYTDEQFIGLLPHTHSDGALKFAKRLREIIAETTVPLDQFQVAFTISYGIKTWDNEADLDTLLRAAGHALDLAHSQDAKQTVTESEKAQLI